jgi:hypothetical protein
VLDPEPGGDLLGHSGAVSGHHRDVDDPRATQLVGHVVRVLAGAVGDDDRPDQAAVDAHQHARAPVVVLRRAG